MPAKQYKCPPAQTSVVSPSKWAAQTSFNMMKAKNLTREMLREVRDNEKAEAESKNAAMENAAREKQRLKEQVFEQARVHGEVIGTASKCMRDIENAISNTSDSISLLRQERFLGFAALQVCMRRIQLRARRPAAELIQDTVADALDNERAVLESAREEFFTMEGDGGKLVDDLTGMRAFLSRDTGERRLVMKHDLLSLKPHLAPPQNTSGDDNHRAHEGDSQALIEKTLQLLARATRHRDKTAEVLARLKEESKKATLRTEDSLAKKTDELADLGKKLKQQAMDVESAISIAERSLDRSDKRMDPGDSTKKEKLMRDRSLLEQLRASRSTLHEEVQHKFIALEIDNMCRRVTPTDRKSVV